MGRHHRLIYLTPLAGAAACSTAATIAPASRLRDVTTTDVPSTPELHALDAAMLDVDADGDLDVAVAVENDVSWLYVNDGKGKLTWRKGAFGNGVHDNEHVGVADFDRDGLMDVVFVAEDDQNHQLFLGDGRGGFTDASDRLPARSQANALAIGDVNGDGLADIVVGNSAEARAGKPAPDPQDFLWLNDPRTPGHFVDATATHMP